MTAAKKVVKLKATEKSPDALRTISEVAALINVQPHVLRFWESRFSQLRPLKRAGGRRYYRPADIRLLKTIHRLLYESGYTIKGVHKLLREQGTSSPESPPTSPTSPTSVAPLAVASGPEVSREVLSRLKALLAEMKAVRGSLDVPDASDASDGAEESDGVVDEGELPPERRSSIV